MCGRGLKEGGIPISEAASCEGGSSPPHPKQGPDSVLFQLLLCWLRRLLLPVPWLQAFISDSQWCDCALACVSQSLSSAEPVMHHCCRKGQVLLPSTPACVMHPLPSGNCFTCRATCEPLRSLLDDERSLAGNRVTGGFLLLL